jgi:transposase
MEAAWMARPYSNDLRERVAAAVASGRRCREVAALFNVSVSSAVKWSQRHRATGSAAAKRMGGHRKRLLEPHRALVIERLKAVPDLTLKALVAELAERGIETCLVSVWRLVRSEGMSFKKKPVRRGASTTGGRQAARAVEEVSGAA